MRALLTFSVSDASLSLLRECFSHVTYLPSTVPDRQEHIHEELQNAQVFITHAKDLAILDAQKTPGENLKIIQIGSAGMDAALKTGWLKSLIDSGRIAKNGEEWKDCQNSREYASCSSTTGKQLGETGSTSQDVAVTSFVSAANMVEDSSRVVRAKSVNRDGTILLCGYLTARATQNLLARTTRTDPAPNDLADPFVSYLLQNPASFSPMLPGSTLAQSRNIVWRRS